jgi:hypothetical protein
MTPKQTAKELVESMSFSTFSVNGVEMGEYITVPRNPFAKECALIAVDEIISSREDDGAFDDTLSTMSEYYTPHPMYLTYWEQVKQEIEKL